jgi:hypothetical protein
MYFGLKICFILFYKSYFKHFSSKFIFNEVHGLETRAGNHVAFHLTCSLLLHNLNQSWNELKNLVNLPVEKFMKIHSEVFELLPA